MNTVWSPPRQDTPFNPFAATFAQSTALPLPDYRSAMHARLEKPLPFFLSLQPFSSLEHGPPPFAGEPVADKSKALVRRFKALRKSPGFALIKDSVLFLEACQLDMDFTPRRRHYVREQLAELLINQVGWPMDPDQSYITFITDTHPSVATDGRERYRLRLSLTDTALACFDGPRAMALFRSSIEPAPLSDEDSNLSAAQAFKLILHSPWSNDYTAALESFWTRHRATYCTLWRLAFLDDLSRHYASTRITREGYLLSLNAMGLADFPSDAASTVDPALDVRAETRTLCVNGEQVPGLFQFRSRLTSHCFIHVLGAREKIIEYISDDPAEMTRRLIAALNDSALHRQVLSALEQTADATPVAESQVIEGDVFAEMTRAHEAFGYALLSTEAYDSIDLLKPVARSLALASAVDFWQTRPAILEQLPQPSTVANQVMADYLREHHGLTLNPEQVYIAYQRGNSITPLGDARTPSTHVHTPDEKPITLSEALIRNYRVDYPSGYIDHDGRSLVFHDASGTASLTDQQALSITPKAVEDYIKSLDFLSLMTRRLETFWSLQRGAIEDAFRSTFITYALISLRLGSLKRSGFDAIVQALLAPDAACWSTLGFYVQGSLIDGMEQQYTGLLLLEQPGGSSVLYQAGHSTSFIEFHSDDELHRHLRLAAASEAWRTAVLRYVPVRHHKRLTYLLSVWGGVQAPSAPASILRPWTDALYNPDTHKAMSHSLTQKKLSGSLFAFLHQVLKQNALYDAQDEIVTSSQISIEAWSNRLRHLQSLLAPLAPLLTPAFIAYLVTEAGITSLNIASARLPGSRYPEKNQALLSALSLGLMHLGPQTPRMLRSLNRLSKPSGIATQALEKAATTPRGISFRPTASLNPRQTRLVQFFHTNALLKRWTVVSHPNFGATPVHAWKLGRRFLLWTSDRGQARTLVVSTHGHYLPWTSTVKIPNGTEIRTYAPHGYELVDPRLHRVVSNRVQAFAASTAARNTPIQPLTLAPLVITDMVMAGTSLTGRLKNYTLSKFQTLRDETYDDIAHIVRNSNSSPLSGQLPAIPMDVLTVRNRFGSASPTLADLFNKLSAQGIHYDRILLVHCRCAALASLMGRSPVYRAPTVRPVIAKIP
ncbi:hypothetical protein KDX38_16165 [Pseudomonas sp. CDFA 602]|uniref:dermonecrotic toxin domain-containing protein n=1 Tax=Pseudomonas californiensis TaxID=2829823 RepID=UPI001E3B17CB|nr:DUF6543 domain-containing protein [Pseudomonas californiensis]MCD5995174.1 hypothetical protein [Pseudomonas californiensis]MCD6000740.1 hypothetical protein [Pseudomonas californiensis]